MFFELEEQREMAINRLTELEKLQSDHQKLVKECEQQRIDVSLRSSHVVFHYLFHELKNTD